jgi:hypothetical protein
MNCNYCGKECKNLNSLKQHEIRCSKNPNRIRCDTLTKYIQANIKGKTKENCPSIAKQVMTMKKRYDAGYIKPTRGKAHIVISRYCEHNTQEIARWQAYVRSIKIELPQYSTIFHNEGYKIISSEQYHSGNTIALTFEHNYLAEQILGHKLDRDNVVHHIDKNRANNDVTNLLIFKSKSAHKRFHASKSAYLIYDEKTQLFDCINKIED